MPTKNLIKNLIKTSALLSFFTLLQGCGLSLESKPSGGGTTPLSTQTITGSINGTPWIFGSGEARKNLIDSTKMDVILWDSPEHAACSQNTISSTERQLYMTFSPTIGEKTLTIGKGDFSNSGFSYLSNSAFTSFPASSAKMNLITITPTSLQLSLSATDNARNSVNGVFSVQICK